MIRQFWHYAIKSSEVDKTLSLSSSGERLPSAGLPSICLMNYESNFTTLNGMRPNWSPPLKTSEVDATLTMVKDGGHGIIATPTFAKEIYRFYQKYLGSSYVPQD